MVKNKSLILGALGQDGIFMSNILLNKGHEVYGVIKKNPTKDKLDNIHYYEVTPNDSSEYIKIIDEIQPNQIYNFMGVTNVFNPWDNSNEVYFNNFLLPLQIIEFIKTTLPACKFLQASSSLIFGKTTETPQNELSIRNPIYHYGYSKNLIDNIIKEYRENFNLFLCSAILYSHESELRGENFLSKKIIKQSVEIKNGLRDKIHLGDVNQFRDIGYVKDYMEACYLILQQETPNDFIIGSNTSINTKELIIKILNKFNLKYDDVVEIDNSFKRNIDLSHLVSDTTKLKNIGWEPLTSVDKMIDIMINFEIKNSLLKK
jgi:GDPmannose 4,6-dehydratase